MTTKKEKITIIAVAVVTTLLLAASIILTVIMKNYDKPTDETIGDFPAERTVIDCTTETNVEIPTILEHETQPKEVGGLDIDVGQMHRNPEPEVVGGTVEYGEKEIDNE